MSEIDFLIEQQRARAWQEKRDTVVILVQGFAKMLSCQNKSTTQLQFWHCSISKKAQLPTIRITEQPILLTKSKMNRKGVIIFLSILAKNGQSNLVLVLVLVLESKGPYYLQYGTTSTEA